jgi:DNA-binding response OmpR family regulator
MERVRQRALIVDDERPIRWLIAQALSNEGFKCEVAESGWQGVSMATDQDYDVVVTDLSMAQGDGHALSTQLLKLAKPPLIFVITGCLDPAIAKDLIERGVEDIVFKPTNFPAFAAKVRALVDRRAISQKSKVDLPVQPLCETNH